MEFRLLVIVTFSTSTGAAVHSQIVMFESEEKLEKAERNFKDKSDHFVNIEAVRI